MVPFLSDEMLALVPQERYHTVFILFLALAAGAIIYVVAELLGGAKRFKAPEPVMWELLLGFLLGYATDLIVTFGGGCLLRKASILLD